MNASIGPAANQLLNKRASPLGQPASVTPRATRRHARSHEASAWVAVAVTLAALSVTGSPHVAHAQTSDILIDAPITPYDRGRNISVTQRNRPEYDPLGVKLGAFILSPSVRVSGGVSDNVYNNDELKKADVFAQVQPYAVLASNWSIHSFRLVGAADLKRYANETLKDENAWYLYGQTRLDIARDSSLLLDAQIDRAFESPYNADITANSLTPSTYLRTQLGAKATIAQTRTRIIATLDHNRYVFSTIDFADGTSRDQSGRDRDIYRGALTYEYGLSPALSVYAQATGDRINYMSPTFAGMLNRDSTGYHAVVGTNFDLSGVARGTIGIGYTIRDYHARGAYRDARGVSIQARGDWFATPLTTVNLSLNRRLMDVSLGNSGAYWDTRLGVRADHELLYNLIVSAGAELIERDYEELDMRTSARFANLSGRYQSTREVGFSVQFGYGRSRPSGARLSDPFNEFRMSAGVQLRR